VLDVVKQHAVRRIYHFVSILSYHAGQMPCASMRANVDGTYHVVEAARLFGVRRVVFSSSTGTYGLDRPDVIDALIDHVLQAGRRFSLTTSIGAVKFSVKL